MTLHASAIIAAEMRVAQSRRDLRNGLRRLRSRLSQPSALAVAVLLGFLLKRRGRVGMLAGMLATTVIRRGVERLVAAADRARCAKY